MSGGPRRRTPWLLLAVGMLALAALGLATLVVPDGPGALVLVLPWLAVVALHVLLGPPAVVLAWRRRQHLAWALALVYFGGFLGWHLWYWATVNELPQRLAAQYTETFAPADHALLEAVRHGTLDAAGLARLRAAGARLDRPAPEGYGLVVPAAAHADGAVLALLLDAGLPVAGADGARALAAAVRNRRERAVDILLAAGVAADAVAPDAPTPLCLAVNAGVRGNLEATALAIVARLLAAGADPNLPCTAVRSAYHSVIEQQQVNTLELLREHGRKLAADSDDPRIARTLAAAVRREDQRLLALLLAAGVPGEDALAQALEQRRPAVVEVLLQHGANAAARPYLNRVVYDESTHTLHAALLAHGADPTLTDARGRDALASVSPRAPRALLEELVAAGADIDASRVDGEPLLIARLTPVPAERAFPRHLLALGADADVRGSDDMTALLRASRMQDVEMLAALAAAGANPRVVDTRGRNALHHALDTADRGDTVAALLALGVPATRRDTDGATPPCLAQQRRRRHALAVFAAAGIEPRACNVGAAR
ncbi:MAG: hypothetical protein RLW61_07915 [Gammaproteobacteria bacterium]